MTGAYWDTGHTPPALPNAFSGGSQTPQERQQEAERNRRARVALTARSMRRRVDEARGFEHERLRAEREAKRALDDHVRELAREIDCARQREVDSGTPTERMVRRQLEQEAFRESVERNARARARSRASASPAGPPSRQAPPDSSEILSAVARAFNLPSQSRLRRP
jgi:hypothetical protein